MQDKPVSQRLYQWEHTLVFCHFTDLTVVPLYISLPSSLRCASHPLELHSGYFPIKEQKHRLYLTKANLLLTVHRLVLDTLKIKFFFQKKLC